MNKRQKLVQQQFLNNEEAIIKRLDKVYQQSLTDITEKIKHLQFDLGRLQQEYDWLDDTDPEKAKVKSMIQSKIYQKKYQEQLKTQLDGILNQMQNSQFVNVSDYLDGCYTDGFLGTIFDAHGQGVPIMTPIDQEAMVRAVQLDSKISKGLYTRLGEDVNLLKRKITAQVSRSIATGMTFAQTAKQLANYSRIGYNNAVRIARTEGHRIQTTATMDAMTAAKDMGADVVKQWDSTLDGNTRESHVAVDGEVRELDKPFSNGLDYPGDPSGSAAEVINCRCALLQRARWAVEGDDKSFTKFNNFTKQVESFDSPESYGEFKKAFFSPENTSFMRYVEQMQDKYGTRDWKTLLTRMSVREYSHYSTLIARNPIYNSRSSQQVHNLGQQALYNYNKDEIQQKYGFNRIEGVHTADDDIKATNPGYGQGKNYQINCQRCVPTYEMRRRGYDVTALPYSSAKDAVYTGWQRIFNGAKWDASIASRSKDKTKQAIVDKMIQYGDGARAEIYCVWHGASSAHVFVAENTGGVVRFVDPQSGSLDVSRYFSYLMPSKTQMCRIDNLEPSDLIKDCCK